MKVKTLIIVFYIYKWRLIKNMMKFFIEFIFLDHSKLGVDVKVNVLRKYIINRFHKAVPASRMLTILSVIDDSLHLIWL